MAAFLRVLFCSLALLAAAVAAEAQRAVRINLGTLAPRGSSYHNALMQMGETWRERSNGRVRLVIYPDGAQGSEADMVRLMRVGTLQSGLLTGGGLTAIEEAVAGLQNMPLVFRDLEELDYVMETLRPMLEARLRARGFETLFWVDAGWVRFFSTEPAVTPADFQRHRMFVWADPKQVAIMRRIGQNPVALESADLPAALQTGMVTAAPLPPIVALASQFDRRVPHMLRLNYAPLVGAAVVSAAAWERVPAELRPVLLEAAREAGEEIRRRSREESDEAVRAMQARGLTVHEVTPAALAEWETVVNGVYPEIRGTLVPAEVFDQVKELLAARRAAGGDARAR
jgi:TRAP-type C4-dicarboxylate transport system substrate-binding protein